MTFNALPNCVKVTFNHTFREQEYINDMWFFCSIGSPTVLNVSDLAQQAYTKWSTNVMPNLSNDVTFINTVARDYSVPNGIEVLYTAGIVVGGGGDAMPNNVAACVSLRTPFAGRHYRGRIYLGGIPRTAVAENDYTSAFSGVILEALNTNFIGAGTVSADFTLSVVAQQAAGAPIPGGIVTPATQWVFADNIVDSQRRRLPGRGK